MEKANEGWQADIHNEYECEIVLVLPHNNRVALKVFDIRKVIFRAVVVAQDPTNMREPEAATGGVGIIVIIVYMLMMTAMVGRPIKHIIL